MAIETQELTRAFKYNSVDLADPGAAYTPGQVRDFYQNIYPEITTAAIEGPEVADGRMVYTFRRAVGTKGADDAPPRFEQWALVELFGHQRIAGLLTEQTIGGCSFIRVDVPAVDDQPTFTKLYGQGAIYGISFVAEEIAVAAAKSYRIRPVSSYEIPELRQLRLPAVDDDQDGEF
jgi:PRTRC genetic system protein C